MEKIKAFCEEFMAAIKGDRVVILCNPTDIGKLKACLPGTAIVDSAFASVDNQDLEGKAHP